MSILELLQDKCDNISDQIKRKGLELSEHYVIDGIIDPEKYVSAKYRIFGY